MRAPVLGGLLLLTACNRGGVADVTLDAAANQRNATAAKTLADLAAADAASRGPAPFIQENPPPEARPADIPAPASYPAAAEDAAERSMPDDQSDAVSNE